MIFTTMVLFQYVQRREHLQDDLGEMSDGYPSASASKIPLEFIPLSFCAITDKTESFSGSCDPDDLVDVPKFSAAVDKYLTEFASANNLFI